MAADVKSWPFAHGDNHKHERRDHYSTGRMDLDRCEYCGHPVDDQPLGDPCKGCGRKWLDESPYFSPGSKGSFDKKSDYSPYRGVLMTDGRRVWRQLPKKRAK